MALVNASAWVTLCGMIIEGAGSMYAIHRLFSRDVKMNLKFRDEPDMVDVICEIQEGSRCRVGKIRGELIQPRQGKASRLLNVMLTSAIDACLR